MKTAMARFMVCLTVTGVACCCRLSGQILIANGTGNSVSAYNFNGTAINTAFVTNTDNALDGPQGIATDGTNLYIANVQGEGIGKFNLFTGEFESRMLFEHAYGIAIDGTNLYVAENSSSLNGLVGQYTVDGTVINASLITLTNANPLGIVIVETNLYLTYANSVGKFNLDGTAVNRELINGLSKPAGLTSDGTYLYIPNTTNGTIGKYGLDGTTNNSTFISGLTYPNGLAINGSTLYVLEVSGQVLTYTLDGILLSSNLISSSASSDPCYGILPINALGVSLATFQSNCFAFNMTGLSNQSVVVSASTGLTDWVPIETNTIGPGPFLFSDPTWTNFPSRFYRVGAL